MNANLCVERTLDHLADKVGKALDATPVTIIGPILGYVDNTLREAVEAIDARIKKNRAVVILDTDGGVVEIVERMVNILRHHFAELHFVIPDRAMSAGTIFAMSGDAIWMDYFGCLGPIDPQIEREGKLVPALSYVVQFEELVTKSQAGALSDAELALLGKLDLADLHYYEQARDLSVSLLVDWLSRYKFKDWTLTETQKTPVDGTLKRTRADQIARALSDNTRWKSHGRPISMTVLRDQLNLKINDLATNPELQNAVKLYFNLARDYTGRTGREQIVHTPGHCL